MGESPAEVFARAPDAESFRREIRRLEGDFPFDAPAMIRLGEAYFQRFPDRPSGRDMEEVRLGGTGSLLPGTRASASRQDLPRLFKRFERLKQKGTEGVKGSGLGLYICRKIVEKHGGRIWAESRPGEGAEFFVALPRKPTS